MPPGQITAAHIPAVFVGDTHGKPCLLYTSDAADE